jgi:hypothetical protein
MYVPWLSRLLSFLLLVANAYVDVYGAINNIIATEKIAMILTPSIFLVLESNINEDSDAIDISLASPCELTK